mmetsp:Transcript_3084/g.6383  ORF Transcript_3084/g.6383 Transcript_3084/m.6383 type:complete len:227 (-) Transcript_3084:47-727(-)
MDSSTFQWFTLETKVRNLVQELIEAATKKSEEQKEFEARLEDAIKGHKLRLEEIELALERLDRKFGYIETLSKKLTVFESSQRIENAKLSEAISALETQVDSLHHFSINFTASVRSFDTQLTMLTDKSKLTSDEVLKLKTELLEKLQATKDYLENQQRDSDSKLHSFQDSLAETSTRFEGLSAGLVCVDVKAMNCEQAIKFLQVDLRMLMKGSPLKTSLPSLMQPI